MNDDGIALSSIAHPQPKWYVRPYWSFRCLWIYWFGFRKRTVETVLGK